MPSTTKIICDCGCKKEIELADTYVPGAEKLLKVIDARAASYWFLSVDCLKNWLKNYKELAPPNLNESLGTFSDETPSEAMPELPN